MANVKLSQIAPSPSNVDTNTQLVAVQGGNTDYLFSPTQFINGFNLLRSNVADQVLTGGWNVVAHTYSTGSVAIDCGQGPAQQITNNGAFTITAPGTDGNCVLLVTNGTTPGVVTFSGFTVGANTGDALTLTTTNKFLVSIWRINGVSSYFIYALQAAGAVAPVSVTAFGADPSGAHDSTAAINNTIVAVAGLGLQSGARGRGGIVWFPSGEFTISSAITNSLANTSVRLIGSGNPITWLNGTISGGYIIDQNTTTGGIISIESMLVINSSTGVNAGLSDITTGAIRFNNIGASGGYIRNVGFSGWTGIRSDSNNFETLIENCTSNGPLGVNQFYQATLPYVSGPIGYYCGTGGLYNCNALGYAIGMWVSGNVDNALVRCRTESCMVGIVAGVVSGSIGVSGCSASIIIAHSAERCDTAIILGSVSGMTLQDITMGISIGTSKGIVAPTSWSGGTVTMTSAIPLANFLWTSGTRQIIVENALSSLNPGRSNAFGYNTNSLPVTATWASATSFTYPLTFDPGTITIDNVADWSFPIQYGLRLRSSSNTTITSLSSSISQITTTPVGGTVGAAIDLFVDGLGASNSSAGVTMTSCNASVGGWLMPNASSKAAFQYINCDNPTGGVLDVSGVIAGMVFTSLPGNAGITGSAVEGDQYLIIDSPVGTTSQGGNFTGVLSTGTLTVSAITGTGLITPGDVLLGSGTSGNVTAGTTIRAQLTGTVGSNGTYSTSGSQTLSSETMTTSFSNIGKIITAGGSSSHATIRCVSTPRNTQAVIGDPTNVAIFSATIGATILASTTINTTTLQVISITPSNAVISFGDTITGAGIPNGTTIATAGSGGVGTFALSQNATSSQVNVAMTIKSVVLNVTGAPTLGTITANNTWTLDGSGVTRVLIVSAGTGVGGVGTYNLAGSAQGPLHATMAAGIAGTGSATLTLTGVSTGTFAVGCVFTIEAFQYVLTQQTATSPNPQWTVTGSTRFAGPAIVNAALWEIVG